MPIGGHFPYSALASRPLKVTPSAPTIKLRDKEHPVGWPTIGAIIGTCLGGFLGMLGATGLASRWRPTAFLAVLATTTLLVTALPLLMPVASSGSTLPSETFVAGLIAALVATIVIVASPPLNLRRRLDLFVPIVGLIGGLHFIGLWRTTNSLSALLIAVALCLISLGAFFVADSHLRRMLAGFGCAVVLWLNAGAALI
jgi:hypothetical protein